LRIVEEHALAARIGTSAHARQLAEDERVGRGFDDGDDESGERVSDGHERANERPIGTEVDAPRAGASAEHAVDLDESLVAYAFAHRPSLGERAQRGAHTTAIDERDGRSGWLLLRATANAARACGVEHGAGFEPAHHALEIAKCVIAAKPMFAVHE